MNNKTAMGWGFVFLIASTNACGSNRGGVRDGKDASARDASPPPASSNTASANERSASATANDADAMPHDSSMPASGSPPATRHASSPDPSVSTLAGLMDAGRSDAGASAIMTTDHPTRDSGATHGEHPDAGHVTSPLVDSGMHARDASGPGDDEGGTADVDADRDSNPCTNGTYQCAQFTFPVTGDFSVAVTGATVSARVGGYVFSTQSVNGQGSLVLPLGQLISVRVEADGYWNAESFAVLDTTVKPSLAVYSTSVINAFLSSLGLTADETKGYIMTVFQPIVTGVSMTIDLSSEAAVVVDSTRTPRLGNTLLDGGDGIISFANVTPGSLTPAVVSPSGSSCSIDPQNVGYSVKPKTVLTLWGFCM